MILRRVLRKFGRGLKLCKVRGRMILSARSETALSDLRYGSARAKILRRRCETALPPVVRMGSALPLAAPQICFGLRPKTRAQPNDS
jgi:hypothetical protein